MPHQEVDAIPAEAATRRAITYLLESISSERPVLLCIDDADQLDAMSRDFVESLPGIAPSLPLLIVIAGTGLARLLQRRDRTTRLGPLSRECTLALARCL